MSNSPPIQKASSSQAPGSLEPTKSSELSKSSESLKSAELSESLESSRSGESSQSGEFLGSKDLFRVAELTLAQHAPDLFQEMPLLSKFLSLESSSDSCNNSSNDFTSNSSNDFTSNSNSDSSNDSSNAQLSANSDSHSSSHSSSQAHCQSNSPPYRSSELQELLEYFVAQFGEAAKTGNFHILQLARQVLESLQTRVNQLTQLSESQEQIRTLLGKLASKFLASFPSEADLSILTKVSRLPDPTQISNLPNPSQVSNPPSPSQTSTPPAPSQTSQTTDRISPSQATGSNSELRNSEFNYSFVEFVQAFLDVCELLGAFTLGFRLAHVFMIHSQITALVSRITIKHKKLHSDDVYFIINGRMYEQIFDLVKPNHVLVSDAYYKDKKEFNGYMDIYNSCESLFLQNAFGELGLLLSEDIYKTYRGIEL